MIVYEKPGPVNTDETCRIGISKAKEIGAVIVSATTEGTSGARLCEMAREMGFEGEIVIVASAFGSREPGVQLLKEEHKAAMLSSGARLVTAAHALSGAERALSTKFGGVYPVEIIANSLRMLSQGIKVVVEIGSMALDAGAIGYGPDIVCMGGSGRGLDTAVVMKAAHANKIFETNIHEVLCLPY
ncbi:MAG: hypothetical protein FWG48_03540 [Oscillospiraceae bacterium]|nr:hypothetical protein [Oscillospiraceae bacterium]